MADDDSTNDEDRDLKIFKAKIQEHYRLQGLSPCEGKGKGKGSPSGDIQRMVHEVNDRITALALGSPKGKEKQLSPPSSTPSSYGTGPSSSPLPSLSSSLILPTWRQYRVSNQTHIEDHSRPLTPRSNTPIPTPILIRPLQSNPPTSASSSSFCLDDNDNNKNDDNHDDEEDGHRAKGKKEYGGEEEEEDTPETGPEAEDTEVRAEKLFHDVLFLRDQGLGTWLREVRGAAEEYVNEEGEEE